MFVNIRNVNYVSFQNKSNCNGTMPRVRYIVNHVRQTQLESHNYFRITTISCVSIMFNGSVPNRYIVGLLTQLTLKLPLPIHSNT